MGEESGSGADVDLDDGSAAVVDAVRELVTMASSAARMIAGSGGVHFADASALSRMRMHGPQTPRRLAGELQLTSGAVSTLIDRLERAGLAVRQPNPGDRRSIVVDITEDGRAVVDTIWVAADRLIADVVREVMADPDLGATTRDGFVEIASRLAAAFAGLIGTRDTSGRTRNPVAD